MKKDKYDYNQLGSKTKRVGQAAFDILSKDQHEYKVEDILDEFGKDYLNLIRKIADEAKDKYPCPFYILSILKKDLGQFGLSNVLKHSALPFNLELDKKTVMNAHPHATKTLFKVDSKNGTIDLLWSLPGWEECKSVLKQKQLYDPDLVKWAEEVS